MNKETQILEFNNGSQLLVMTILGGPVNLDGITRDVLTIEVDASSCTMDQLKLFFNNKDKLAHLYTYEQDFDDNGDLVNQKMEIGEGYMMLLDIQEVHRKVNPFPGKIVPEQYEDIYQVTLAQYTYDEWVAYLGK